MNFSKEQLKKLTKVWEKQEEITISGVTGLGDPFVTTGRITTTDSGEKGVYDDIMYVEFGKSKNDPTNKRTSYFAPFNLDASDRLCEEYFVIFEIKDTNGNIIFKNTKQEEITKYVCETRVKKDEIFAKEGRTLKELDPVTEKLQNLVGKAIILDDVEGVLVNVLGANNAGAAMVHIFSGPYIGGLGVYKDSVLYVEDNDGNIKLVAQNDPEKCKALFEERINKIEEAEEKDREDA